MVGKVKLGEDNVRTLRICLKCYRHLKKPKRGIVYNLVIFNICIKCKFRKIIKSITLTADAR